jgi:hypothetical protein
MTTGTRSTGTNAKPVPRVAPAERMGRACSVCGERLSSYNPGPNCYAHTVGLPWKGPNHRA